MKKNSTFSEDTRTGQDHAAWVRSHTPIDDSAFPEYPDERKRRGSSRGALPNGIPWHPELVTEKPGPRRLAPPSTRARRPARGVDAVEAPPKSPAPVAVVRAAASPTDRRIGDDVSRRLASAKSLEGKLVTVEVSGAEVTLRGRLPRQAAKNEAERLASSVRSVKRIRNLIRIG